MICREANSVISDEIMQVKRIMMTMPLSMSLLTMGWPSDIINCMPTITMAMAPAAWAEVRPNIMLALLRGIRNPMPAI